MVTELSMLTEQRPQTQTSWFSSIPVISEVWLQQRLSILSSLQSINQFDRLCFNTVRAFHVSKLHLKLVDPNIKWENTLARPHKPSTPHQAQNEASDQAKSRKWSCPLTPARHIHPLTFWNSYNSVIIQAKHFHDFSWNGLFHQTGNFELWSKRLRPPKLADISTLGMDVKLLPSNTYRLHACWYEGGWTMSYSEQTFILLSTLNKWSKLHLKPVLPHRAPVHLTFSPISLLLTATSCLAAGHTPHQQVAVTHHFLLLNIII